MIRREYSKENIVSVCKNQKDVESFAESKKGVFPVRVAGNIAIDEDDCITFYRGYFELDRVGESSTE